MKKLKKALTAVVLAVVFISGIALGDLFGGYIPLKKLDFKKITRIADKENTENKKENINNDDAREKSEADWGLTDEQITNKAKEILARMSLDEKIYQMMFVTPESIVEGIDTCIAAGDATREAIEKYPVGGIIYFDKNIKNASQLKEMISNTKSFSKVPLFIGVDEEGGSVRRLGDKAELNMTQIGDMSDFGKNGDSLKVYSAAKTIAEEIKEFGFNVDFAPVADVLTNSENTVVKKRSFSSDVGKVAVLASSFVCGLQDNGISACLKHFPGHGGTAGDTHDGYSENSASKEEILKNETEAFKKGIKDGCDFVMTGHISMPNLTGSDLPCSLSKVAIKELLKDEYDFEGVVITDALNMGAISQNYSSAKAAVLAVSAGNDMLLMPMDLEETFNAIKENVGGKISQTQIDESVLRILRIKVKRGIINL